MTLSADCQASPCDFPTGLLELSLIEEELLVNMKDPEGLQTPWRFMSRLYPHGVPMCPSSPPRSPLSEAW